MVVKATEIERMLKSLTVEIQVLGEENLILKQEVATLKERLAKYENPKNSSNSSTSPSQDPLLKTMTKNTRKPMSRGLPLY